MREPQGNNRSTDIYELPQTYKRWLPGLRSWIRLRYLELKHQVLLENRQAMRYDVGLDEIHDNVFRKLEQKSTGTSTATALFSKFLILPLVLLALAASFYTLWHQHNARQLRTVFKHDVPAFSDTIYQLKAARVSEASQAKIEALELQAENTKQKIVDYFKDSNQVANQLESMLDGVTEQSFEPQEYYKRIKAVNDVLYDHDVPYYMSPMSEAADCNHLPMTAFLERLFGGEVEPSGETCVIYALLSFHVEDYRYYDADSVNHRAFFTRRLDRLDLNDNILGKVHLGDNTAQILPGCKPN